MAAVRNTVQREVILQTVLGMCNHPTADEIYEVINRQYPTISRATVYRNLNLLAEQGQINRVSMPNGADGYDFQTRKHYHVRCRECRRIYDMQIPYMPELDKKVRGDFEITGHTITFEGICPACRKRQTKASSQECVLQIEKE